MTMILMVCRDRKVLEVAVAPTVKPRKIVTMFISSLDMALLRRSATPDSLARLPSIRQATSGAAEGTSRATNTVIMIGKTIFSFWLT